MQKINLRELYPDMYKTDTFLEVTDEVQAVFLSDKRAEAAHERQMYRYKAQYSLDCDNGIEDAVVHRSPTPESRSLLRLHSALFLHLLCIPRCETLDRHRYLCRKN